MFSITSHFSRQAYPLPQDPTEDDLKHLAETNPKACIKIFETFQFKNEKSRTEVALRLAHFHPKACMEHFEKLHIHNESDRVTILTLLAKNITQLRELSTDNIDVNCFIDNFHKFHIEYEENRRSLVSILADIDPIACAKNFKKFNLQMNESRTAIGLIIARKNPQACFENFEKLNLQTNESRLDIAMILAHENPQACMEKFEKLKLEMGEDRTKIFHILTILAEKEPRKFIVHFKKFSFLNEEERTGIGMLLSHVVPANTCFNFEIFKINEEENRIKLANVLAVKDPVSFANRMNSFCINDNDVKFELLKTIAESAETFNKLTPNWEKYPSIFNQIYRLDNEDHRYELSLILATKIPKICLNRINSFKFEKEEYKENLVRFLFELIPGDVAAVIDQIHLKNEKLRFELLKKLAEADPISARNNFWKFKILDLVSRIEIYMILAKKGGVSQQWFRTHVKFIADLSNYPQNQWNVTQEEVFQFLHIFALYDKNYVSYGSLPNYDRELFIASLLSSKEFDPAPFLKISKLTGEERKRIIDSFIIRIIEGKYPDIEKTLIDLNDSNCLSLTEIETIQDALNKDTPTWAMLNHMKLLNQQRKNFAINPGRMVVHPLRLPSIQDVTLTRMEEQLFQFLDLIDIHDETSPFYRDPNSLLNERTIVTKEGLRVYLQRLLFVIKNKSDATAVPSGESKEKYYEDLTKMLGGICQALGGMIVQGENGKWTFKEQEGISATDLGIVFCESIFQVALAGSACGTRWRETLFKIYKIVNKINDLTPQEQIEQACADFRYDIADRIFHSDIHGFGYFVKHVGKELQIPGYEIASETMRGWRDYTLQEAKQMFLKAYNPLAIIRYIKGKYEGEKAFKDLLDQEFEKILPIIYKTEIEKECNRLTTGQDFQDVIKLWQKVWHNPSRMNSETRFAQYLDALQTGPGFSSAEEMKKFLNEKFALKPTPEIIAIRDKRTRILTTGDSKERLTPEERKALLEFDRKNSEITSDIDPFIDQLIKSELFEKMQKCKEDGTSLDQEEYQRLANEFINKDYIIKEFLKFIRKNSLTMTKEAIESLFANLRCDTDRTPEKIESKLMQAMREVVFQEFKEDFKNQFQQELLENSILLERAIGLLLVRYETFVS